MKWKRPFCRAGSSRRKIVFLLLLCKFQNMEVTVLRCFVLQVHSKIDLPWLTSTVGYYLSIAWEKIVQYSILLWQFLVYYAHIIGIWLQENVFTYVFINTVFCGCLLWVVSVRLLNRPSNYALKQKRDSLLVSSQRRHSKYSIYIFRGKLSGENIKKALSSSLAAVQSFSSSALQWVVQLFNTSKWKPSPYSVEKSWTVSYRSGRERFRLCSVAQIRQCWCPRFEWMAETVLTRQAISSLLSQWTVILSSIPNNCYLIVIISMINTKSQILVVDVSGVFKNFLTEKKK